MKIARITAHIFIGGRNLHTERVSVVIKINAEKLLQRKKRKMVDFQYGVHYPNYEVTHHRMNPKPSVVWHERGNDG